MQLHRLKSTFAEPRFPLLYPSRVLVPKSLPTTPTAQNVLLTLLAFDHPGGGLHYGIAFLALHFDCWKCLGRIFHSDRGWPNGCDGKWPTSTM
jgi:hypothetical protein